MDLQFPNLRHLRVCLEVAKTTSVSAASKRVHLSQPAISQAIAKLEKTLGIDLFDRGTNGIFPTQPGKLYFKRVDRALAHLRLGADPAQKNNFDTEAVDKGYDRFLTAAQLRALVALSRSNNFSIAARSIGISQPSLHRAARDLEKVAGTEFFKTGKQGVELTKSADILARHAMLSASELRHGYSEIQEYLGLEPSRIYVGTLPLARSHILPASIDTMIKENRFLQVQIIDGPYGEQLHRLRQGEIDFMIGALRDQTPIDDIVQETLFVDTLAVVVRKGHPVTKKKSVTLGDVLTYPWIAPPKNTPTGKYLLEKLGIGAMDATPVRIVSSSMLFVRSLLLRGDYVTIISTHQIRQQLEQGELVQVPLDMSDSDREIGLTYRLGWHPTPNQSRLLDIIRDVSKTA